jgi:hypothetical protein
MRCGTVGPNRSRDERGKLVDAGTVRPGGYQRWADLLLTRPARPDWVGPTGILPTYPLLALVQRWRSRAGER